MDKLPYVKAECSFYTTILGFEYCRGLDAYRENKPRDKVICKVQLAKVIAREYYLTDSCAEAYGDYLMLLLTGFESLDDVLVRLKNFYEQDEKFRRYLASVYYVKYSLLDDDIRFLDLLATLLKEQLSKEITRFLSTLRGTVSPLFRMRTGTDIYFVIDESIDQNITYDSRYEVEVISNAKNWFGRIQPRD